MVKNSGPLHCFEYSDKEKDRIIELRNRFSDITLSEEQKEDSYLVRWLRARSLDVGKAELMLRNHLKWRKDNNVDGILERESLPPEVKLRSPIAYCGTNQDGYPIYVIPVGKFDYRANLEKYGFERCMRINIINMEMICKLLKEETQRQGKPITQLIEIMDMEGFTYRQMGTRQCRELMTAGQTMMDENYPELLRSCVIVNSPKILAVLFALMKPIIPQHTLDKMSIFGPDMNKWKKVIAEKFPLDKIPKYWGGNLEGVDEFCSGSDIWLQGPKDMKPIMLNLEEDTSDFTTVTVNARNTSTIDIDVPEKNSVIEWKFKTEDYDIGFQMFYNGGGANNDEQQMIIPFSRVQSQHNMQDGTHTCSIPGKYSFVFDNTYSLIKHKTLLYKINVIDPIEIPTGDFSDCPEF